MREDTVQIKGHKVKIYKLNTVIVGSGAAGLNAAERLYSFGQKDIAIVTEGINNGTSRNTGSDKQTYYKLTLAGNKPDSVYEMAKTLYNGESMDGDIALVESALSVQCFYHLVDIGVPFPHNRFGEYIGYKTDHDQRRRATSAGPYTSKYMTEKLEQHVRKKNIKIFNKYKVIGILTDSKQKRALGLLALNLKNMKDPDSRYTLFNCTNIIYATGGPAGLYHTSVYPKSQVGSTGIALESGVMGKNLTESQYGISSTKFRWNLSGTYQQVLPRYISTKQDGSNPKEFLQEYFPDPGSMLNAIFLKGYQWPFDPRKIDNYGSSLIDVLVYNETVNKGRRVWLDFTKNTDWASHNGELNFSLLNTESYVYLKNSDILFGTPIERLKTINQPAIDLYRKNGIDLNNDYLEIAVCAQHNNGGLYGNLWWESNLQHFFPVGEVNGTHGVYRPGGSALNSGQVGGTRAAQYIYARYNYSSLSNKVFLHKTLNQVVKKISLGEKFMTNMKNKSNIKDIREIIGKRMSKIGASIRSLDSVKKGIISALHQLNSLAEETILSSVEELHLAFENYDLLLTQYIYLSAIRDYIEKGGKSRGSYLIYDSSGFLPLKKSPEIYRFNLSNGLFKKEIQKVLFCKNKCYFQWDKVKPLPEEKNWFERIWNDYMDDMIIKKYED